MVYYLFLTCTLFYYVVQFNTKDIVTIKPVLNTLTPCVESRGSVDAHND
jgi:hypothetical protein